MPNPLDVKTAKQLAATVTFTWGKPGDEHVQKYVRWDDDVSDFTSAPELEVETEKQHGGVADVPYNFVLRNDRFPISLLIRPYAFATITVEIGELDPDDVAGTYRVHFAGRISQSTRYTKALSRLVKCDVVGWKERMAYPLGLMCTNYCQHVFCDDGCGKALIPLRQDGVCNALSGRIISVLSIDEDSFPDDYFLFGEASHDGLSLMITKTVGGGQWQLIKPPPPEWLGQTLGLYPGCNKKYSGGPGNSCEYWENQKRFLGLGLFMPDHNPITEPG